MHALENHLARRALEPQHALVAQHARPKGLHQSGDEFFQSRRIERTVAAEHEGGDVIGVAAMRVAVMGMFIRMIVAAVIAAFMVMVMMFVFLQEVRVDVELFVQVEAANIEYLRDRRFTEVGAHDRCARIDSLEPRLERCHLLGWHQVRL